MSYDSRVGASRVDGNQAEIVATLRGMGCTVQHLHEVGAGCPDLLVGCRGVNLLFEIKTESSQLNAGQMVWHNHWAGSAIVVRNSAQAAQIIADVWHTTGAPVLLTKNKWSQSEKPQSNLS